MKMGGTTYTRAARSGFTIVELLIVVVVIAILAAITIVAYTGIQDRARASTLQADVASAFRAMEIAKVESGTETYPTTLPSNVRPSDGNYLSLSEETNGFCVNGESLDDSLRYYYGTTSGGVQEGTCAGPVVANSEVGIQPNLVNDTTFTALNGGNESWATSVGGGTNGFTVSTRSGTATDPYPSRPVLRLANVPTPSASWSLLRGPVNTAEIIGGESYTTEFWVRLASGSHPGTIYTFGVMSGSATNIALQQQANANTPNATWTKVTRTVTASQNGTSDMILYTGLNVGLVRTNTFTLEFQGFELRRDS